MGPSMRLKNKDIAKRLGISPTAVSLALNGRPGVSEETRRKVLELVGESARENMSAFDAATSQPAPSRGSGCVVLAVHKKHGSVMNEKPFFSKLLETAQVEAQRLGYTVSLAHYTDGQPIDEFIDYIDAIGPAGVIVEATEILEEDLAGYKRLGVPVVLMDCSFDLGQVDAVELDNQVAFVRALDYAYQMGHRDIGLLRSSVRIMNFDHMTDGYLKGVHMHGLEDANTPIIDLGCTVETAYEDMKAFLANVPADFVMPTCFLAQLDYIAIGAMRALTEAGYRIPEDVSIIGYDDVPMAAMCNPPLTTTRVNRGDAGGIAMKVLNTRIVDDPDYTLTIQVSSSLVERQSVKRLTT